MDYLKPTFTLEYNGKNITKSIEDYLISITFTDKTHGEADEISIVLDNSSEVWSDSWYPNKGDKIRLEIGYIGKKLRNCGTFEFDEPEFSGPPDILTLKGNSVGITKSFKQKNSKPYENKTLKQLAQKIATKHGYDLLGNIKDIKIGRIVQYQQTDLSFLKQTAERFGHIIKINDAEIVFYSREILDDAKAVKTIDKSDVTSYRLVDKSLGVYSSCSVQYYDPNKKKVVSHKENLNSDSKNKNGNCLKIKKRAENKQQAEQMSKSALRSSKKVVEGSISMPGEPFIYAGHNIELTGFKKLSGKYANDEVSHTISRSGYTTESIISK